MSDVSPLISMSAPALRADPDRTNSLLRAAASDWEVQSAAEQQRIILNVLEACLESGASALRPGDVAKLLIPLLKLMPTADDLEPYKATLERIAARDGMDASQFVLGALRARGVVVRSDEAHAPSFAPVAGPSADSDILAGAEFLDDGSMPLPRMGEFPTSSDARALSRMWLARREVCSDGRRFEIDHWIIRSSVLRRQSLDLEYCEALRVDDTFWRAPATLDFAAALPTPFGSSTGELQAACLNTRLRFLRPGMFLHHPEAVVVTPIGSRTDKEEVLDALFEDVSYPFLRSIQTLQAERRRGRSPRKTVLDEVEQYLREVLSRFGLRVLHQTGDLVGFDPAAHISGVPIDQGDGVLVLQPGLIKVGSGTVLLRATVTRPLDHDHSDTEEQDDE